MSDASLSAKGERSEGKFSCFFIPMKKLRWKALCSGETVCATGLRFLKKKTLTRPGSAAADFGQEIRHAEEDAHQQQVGAERQQRQGVHEAGVQPQVAHWQQPAQVLLDHTFPRPNAVRCGEEEREGGGAAKQEEESDG